MTKLVWGTGPTILYENGVDRGVLYPMTGTPVAWNGLTAVDEGSDGGEVEEYHFDGVKYNTLVGSRFYQATVKALSYPPAFGPCAGEVAVVKGFSICNQPRVPFSFSYRTMLGEDKYKIHIVYNATATPQAKSIRTLSSSVAPSEYSWLIDAVPPMASSYRPTAHFIVNAPKTTLARLTALENVLYGTGSADPRLPTPVELQTILSS